MKPNIDEILERYWEGESSLEDEQILKSYFKDGVIADDHKAFQDFFGWSDLTSAIACPVHVEIEGILAKYWEGETSVKEEEILKSYFRSGKIAEAHQPFAKLFEYYSDLSSLQYTPENVINIEVESNVRTISFRRVVYAIAAVSVLVLGSIFVVNNLKPEVQQTKYTNVHEIEDPEEALRVTKEALALVSTKFRKSQESVKKNLGALEKVSIFK